MSRRRDAAPRSAQRRPRTAGNVSILWAAAVAGASGLAGEPAAAQEAEPEVPLAPIVVEAESGALGADFVTGSDGDVTYVTITSTLGGTNPTAAERVIDYRVTFPAAGEYDFYVRVFVGPSSGEDDSLFYPNGFGAKDPTDGDAWITANQLGGAGFSAPDDVIDGAGLAGGEIWKWVRLSSFDGGEPPISFTVPEGELVQTFQLGGREDGLFIDKLAFVPAGAFQTVAELDQGLPGTYEPPPPPVLPDPYTPPGPPLADGKEKFLGCAYSPSQAQDFVGYFNQVTPENAGKWGSVEAVRDEMNWAGLDEAYELAKSNGFPFRLHVLVWGNQQPGWMEALPPDEQFLEIEEWFAAVAERYPDLDQIEVVNEALRDPPNTPTAATATTRAPSAATARPAGIGCSTPSAWRASTSRPPSS